MAILRIPLDDRCGHLEKLCVNAAHWANRTIGSETDHFMARLLADKWSDSRYGKAWLRSNLAARCQSDPFIPLGKVFADARHHWLIPTEHNSFNQISDFLVSFAFCDLFFRFLFLKSLSPASATISMTGDFFGHGGKFPNTPTARMNLFGASRRLGTNWRRKRHQWWCSSKVGVRRNRADGHHRRKGRHGKSYER